MQVKKVCASYDWPMSWGEYFNSSNSRAQMNRASTGKEDDINDTCMGGHDHTTHFSVLIAYLPG